MSKTNPGMVKVVYRKSENGNDNGIFIYDPKDNCIEIYPHHQSASRLNLSANDVPALIKALRDFFE